MVQVTPEISSHYTILNTKMMPLYLIDYVWVIVLYFSAAFWLAVLIDGYLLPKYNKEHNDNKSTIRLYFEVFLQVALQGFLAIIITALLNYAPSPFNGIKGYHSNTKAGQLLRNPAVISVVLFALSHSLQQKIQLLFARFTNK